MIYGHVIAAPKGLLSMGECHIRKLQPFTSAEVLWCLDECPPHRDIISVPDSGSRHLKPVAILRNNVLAVPQRILPFEHAAVQIYAAALLKRRLAVVKYRIIYIEIFSHEKSSLTCQKLLSYDFLFFFLIHLVHLPFVYSLLYYWPIITMLSLLANANMTELMTTMSGSANSNIFIT